MAIKLLGSLCVFVMLFSGAILAAEKAADSGDRQYHICANDLLDISVYDEPDLSKSVRVSNEGRINYPLLGNVEVMGLTAADVESKLREMLEKDYLVNPQVNVLIKEYAKIYVLGQVKKPGAFELRTGMTAIDAIALAGGLTDIASANGTKVMRKKNGKEQVINVPVDSVLRGGNKADDVVLEPDDTVVVPESFF